MAGSINNTKHSPSDIGAYLHVSQPAHAEGGIRHEVDMRTYQSNEYRNPLTAALCFVAGMWICVAFVVGGLVAIAKLIHQFVAPMFCVLLCATANAADLRVHVFADDDNTFQEVHGETQNVLWATGKLYFRERVTTPTGGSRWTRWYWIDNMTADINNESGGAYQVTIETFNGGLTSLNNNSLGWQLAIAGGVSSNNRNLITMENDIQGASKAYNVQHQPAYYPAINGYIRWRDTELWTAWLELANWYIHRIDQ